MLADSNKEEMVVIILIYVYITVYNFENIWSLTSIDNFAEQIFPTQEISC